MFQFIVAGSMGSCMSLQQKTTLTYFVSIISIISNGDFGYLEIKYFHVNTIYY